MTAENLPRINAESCLLATTAVSNCRACIDVCPKNAWILTEESIDLDANSCDGCALCAPVCTTNSIVVENKPILKLEHNILSIVCSDVSEYSALNRIECIHSIDLLTLVSVYRDGMRRIRLCIGGCSDCDRSSKEGFWSRFMGLNSALFSRNMPMIVLEYSHGLCMERNDADIEQPDRGRRGFFSKLLGLSSTASHDDLSSDYLSKMNSPGQWLESTGFKGPLPYVPVMDTLSCSACHACVKICPARALVHDDKTSYYLVKSELCIGCMLCVDICEDGAISVDSWKEPKQTEIPLLSKQCEACGVTYSMVEEKSEMDVRCSLCRSSDRFSNLFQVID
ncbi:MAG: 4Fe-4S binding protein [Candidatus Sedimenticola sp. PURPLELP]